MSSTPSFLLCPTSGLHHAFQVSKLPGDFAPTTLHGLVEAFKGVASRTPKGSVPRDGCTLTITASDLLHVPDRASWGPGNDGAHSWRGHHGAGGAGSPSIVYV